MTPEQKQSALQRVQAILQATLKYLEDHSAGSIVFDQYDPAMEYYRRQKIQMEKYSKQGRLDLLQKQLARLTRGLQSGAYVDFNSFIQKQTGYDIDIFEDLQTRVKTVIAQGEIRTQKDLNDIATAIHVNNATNTERQEIEKLTVLLGDYSKQAIVVSGKMKELDLAGSVKEGDIEEKTITSAGRAKSKHYEEWWAGSPDGKRKLRVGWWSDHKQASTFVAIHFPASTGVIYSLSSLHTDIKAWWKDNSTIVIETKEDYEPDTQCRQVCSFGDIITIEYIEH